MRACADDPDKTEFTTECERGSVRMGMLLYGYVVCPYARYCEVASPMLLQSGISPAGASSRERNAGMCRRPLQDRVHNHRAHQPGRRRGDPPRRPGSNPTKSMSLKYEPDSEPLHISVKCLFSNREPLNASSPRAGSNRVLLKSFRSRRSFISSPLWKPQVYGPTS